MKHKIVALSKIVCITAGLLCSCGKKDVDYFTEKSGTPGSGTGSLSSFAEEENRRDEWTVLDADGQEQTITINVKSWCRMWITCWW